MQSPARSARGRRSSISGDGRRSSISGDGRRSSISDDGRRTSISGDGRRNSISADQRTPEISRLWRSSTSSTIKTCSSGASGRSPVALAARAFVSCFTARAGSAAADRVSSKGDISSEEFKYSNSGSTQGSSSQSSRGNFYGTSQDSGVRISGRGIYNSREIPKSQRENGVFTLSEIRNATKNFSPSLKIGQGGFGTVYKGTLDNGTVVAVKRAKKKVYDSHLSLEFQSEIQTLARVEHLNLVRFIGYLEHEGERIVLEEYVPNGTLREHLDGSRGNILDLATRLDIAIDVAHAVTYLHMYTDHPIIHRDIKSSNILLTENLRAKVADFGFARLGANEADVSHVSTQVKGTAGYLDPEYLRTYQLTVKSDVYSFGVLLVELLSARRPVEPKKELKERLTAKWAMKKFTEGNGLEILDPNLPQTPATNLALEKILELAFQCLAPTRQSRPSMRRCAEILWNIRKDYQGLLALDPLSQQSHHRDLSVSSKKEEMSKISHVNK